jgi:hypothetical protein
MTLNALLAFMVISQIAVSAYLLYSFNTIERASKRRHDALAGHMDDAFAELESRLTGVPRSRSRTASARDSLSAGPARVEVLQPRQV